MPQHFGKLHQFSDYATCRAYFKVYHLSSPMIVVVSVRSKSTYLVVKAESQSSTRSEVASMIQVNYLTAAETMLSLLSLFY